METLVVKVVEPGCCVKYEFDDGSYFVEALSPGFFEEATAFPEYGEYSVETMDVRSVMYGYLEAFCQTDHGQTLVETFNDVKFIKFGKYL